jgi:mono/diheme cytochrome c family protein
MTDEAHAPEHTRARRTGVRLGIAALALALGAVALSSAIADPKTEAKILARGQYLVTVMDCTGCHTPGSLAGQPDLDRRLGGSDIGFALGPDASGGVVYPPNLTPDRETGLGAWSDAEIIRAIRAGQRKNGRVLVPIMPWPSYAALSMADARAIVAYLRTIPPVRHAVPANVKAGDKPTKPYLAVVDPAK